MLQRNKKSSLREKVPAREGLGVVVELAIDRQTSKWSTEVVGRNSN